MCLIELLSMYRISKEVIFRGEENYFFSSFVLGSVRRMRFVAVFI